MQFLNQTAISTGAASGMGLCLAQNWAKEGGNVLMCDINMEVLNEKVAEINAEGRGRAVGMYCDVRDYAQVCAARDKAVELFGSIDLMCNFAGGTAVRMCKVDRAKYPEFPDVPIEVFDWGLDVNLRAQLYFAHAVIKQMREQKSGLIINIGSITGEEGDGYGVEYGTAKSGAMYGLTKSVAKAGAPYGVRCVCISPGPVMTRPAMANMKTLLGRAAEPQEIIDMVLFLASAKGQFINGTNILIDGGRNAMNRG
ncbi:MAG: SDR family oxidoreductase [Clostridia bacterium]|nr:SDR family oxidoreductase [Clostridia bacterium]